MKVFNLVGPKGDVDVVDFNDNEIFDSGDCTQIVSNDINIIDIEISAIGSDEKEVQQRLRAMGLGPENLKGIRLNPLQAYLQNMSQAEQRAKVGHVLLVETFLKMARENATKSGISFDVGRADKILDLTYRNGYKVAMGAAEKAAEKKDPKTIEFYLQFARECSNKANIAFDEKRAAKIQAKGK